LRVVIVQNVSADTVRQRRVLRGRFDPSSHDGRLGFAAEIAQMTIDLAAGLFVGTGHHSGKTVEQVFFRASLNRSGNVLQADLRNPRGDLLRGVMPPFLHGRSGYERRRLDFQAESEPELFMRACGRSRGEPSRV
jgi:hypothetical protein